MGIDPEYVQRIAALERKVTDLYQAIGRPEPADTVALSPQVLELIANNDLVGAVKVHREQTGTDLAVAKQDIDNYLNQAG